MLKLNCQTPPSQRLAMILSNHAVVALTESLDMVMDIPITLSLELGHTRMSVRELLQLTQGSVVKLDRPGGDPLDILVNGCLVAQGEVVVINDRFGVRITDIASPEERIRRLR